MPSLFCRVTCSWGTGCQDAKPSRFFHGSRSAGKQHSPVRLIAVEDVRYPRTRRSHRRYFPFSLCILFRAHRVAKAGCRRCTSPLGRLLLHAGGQTTLMDRGVQEEEATNDGNLEKDHSLSAQARGSRLTSLLPRGLRAYLAYCSVRGEQVIVP